jgi:hypothetical protein
MMDKRQQNAEWRRRKELGLPPQEGAPNRLQNVFADNHGRIEDPMNFTYRLQDDEYGKYSLLTVNKNTLIIQDERGIHIRYNRYTENKWFFGECIKEN